MPSSSKESASIRSKADKPNASVTVKTDEGIWLGVFSLKDISLKKGKIHAGALIVGLVIPNCIISHCLEDGRYWVCVIQDGRPIVDHDRVVDDVEHDQLLMDWQPMFPNADLVGTAAGARMPLESIIEDLDLLIANKELQKSALNKCLLSRSPVNVKNAIFVIVVLSATLGAAFAYDAYNVAQQREKNEQLRLQQEKIEAEQKRLLELERQKKIDEFNASIATARANQTESRTPLLVVYEAFNKIRRTIPISKNGYKPQEMRCNLLTCSVSWIGGDGSIPSGKLELPNVEPNFAMDNQAVSIFTTSMPSTRESILEMVSRFISVDDMHYELYNTMKVLDQAIVVLPPTIITLTPPPGVEATPVELGAQGEIHYSANGDSALIDVHRFLTTLSAWPVVLRSMDFTEMSTATPKIQVHLSYVWAKR